MALDIDSSGNIAVGGYSKSDMLIDNDHNRMPIAAYLDSSAPGTYFWAKVLGGEGRPYVYDVKFNPTYT
jgi:hypothetical protein